MQSKDHLQKRFKPLKQTTKLLTGLPVRTNLCAGVTPEDKDEDFIEPFQNSVNLNIADPLGG